MDTKLLIDAIVRQTTVLIAQLSTAAGIRAPLAHVADQVFLDLAREIEAQGIGRKVVADMFGLSLHSYQKKMHRLAGSESFQGKSMWEALIDFVRTEGSVTRKRLEERFRYDDARAVAAVLKDLVTNGVFYATGKGQDTVYGLTTESDRRLIDQQSIDAVCATVWMEVYRHPVPRSVLEEHHAFEQETVEQAVNLLLADGRLECDDAGILRAGKFVVPIGAKKGWEAAVFDHYRAVATAIAIKVQGSRTAEYADVVGGSTLCFDVHPQHPHREKVMSLLKRIREDTMKLWNEVTAENEAHPIPEEQIEKLYFYCGQYLEENESSGSEPAPSTEQ